ncbi:DUF2947 domain-containing protein [bacterium]|nr:DUF2947 domain-containing protein [bacterium]
MNTHSTPIANSPYDNYFDSKAKNYIYLLSLEHSSKLWEQNIDRTAQSYSTLAESNWLHTAKRDLVGDWLTPYNKHRIKTVTLLLQNSIKWKLNNKVYYCINKEVTFETTWQVFLHHWREFLLVRQKLSVYHEFSLLISTSLQTQAVIFNPHGRMDTITKPR